MANSLYPAFVTIEYQTAYGIHLMTIPARAWNPAGGVGDNGTFNDWNDDPVDAEGMVTDLVTLFLPFFPATTNFNVATIYTLEAADSDPNPRVAFNLDLAGTSVSATWAKAVQTTYTFRTDLFGIYKLVFLDAPSGNDFDRVNAFGAAPAVNAIKDELALETNAWNGRDNGRIVTLLAQTKTLNEKLRKEYNMD